MSQQILFVPIVVVVSPNKWFPTFRRKGCVMKRRSSQEREEARKFLRAAVKRLGGERQVARRLWNEPSKSTIVSDWCRPNGCKLPSTENYTRLVNLPELANLRELGPTWLMPPDARLFHEVAGVLMCDPDVEELRSKAMALPRTRFLEAAGWSAVARMLTRPESSWHAERRGVLRAAAKGEFLRAFMQAILREENADRPRLRPRVRR